jgi:hypothetical protein
MAIVFCVMQSNNRRRCDDEQSVKQLNSIAHGITEINENLLTQRIYVFCVDLRKKQRLFPYTALTDWFV